MSTAPDRTWLIRSGSDPSWPAGNRRSSIRPDVASRTRSAASASLTLIGGAAGWEVATLKLNSGAAEARLLQTAAAVKAAKVFKAVRRVAGEIECLRSTGMSNLLGGCRGARSRRTAASTWIGHDVPRRQNGRGDRMSEGPHPRYRASTSRSGRHANLDETPR